MEQLMVLPEEIKLYLASKGIWPKDIKLSISGDISLSIDYPENWIIVTSNELIILKGETQDKKTSTKKSLDRKWLNKSFEKYSLEGIENITCENMVSGGILTITVEGKYVVLCRYSGGLSRKMGQFTRLFNKTKEGKDLDEADLQDETEPKHCPKCGLLYPDQSRAICPKCLDRRSLFKRVLSYTPRYKVQITLILACMFLSTLISLISPYISGMILFDEVLKVGGKYHGRILEAVALIFIIQFASLTISIAYGRINAGITAKIIYDLKTEVFTAMQRLSLSFFSSKQTGTLMTRVNYDAEHLQYFFHDGLPYFIVNIITIIGISITLISINWALALLVLIPMPGVIMILKKMLPKLYEKYHNRYRRVSSMNATLNDALTGIRVVKAFGKEKDEVNRFTSVNEGVYDADLDIGKYSSTMFPFVSFLMGIGGIIIWGFGGWMVVKDSLTFGTLITFTAYLGMLYGPLQFMTEIVNWWSSCMNSAQRIFEILDSVPEVQEHKNPVRMGNLEGNIVLDNVTFSYEVNKPVLHDITLEIKAGEMIGLVGHSGAGKSTTTNIISRLYDVQEGKILIDGVDIKKISLKDLHNKIGMVLQDTVLFSGSIRDNIAFAKPDASFDEIIKAAKAANAHNFIMKLPDGYDTIIGKKGQDLSGGEKQRLSIARAILHDPKILILDEATSSLDTETERQIQEALSRLVKDRTTIAIAHRLSTLRNADRLVVIEQGRIKEVGTHSELVNLKGIYYKMLEQQREALKIKGVAD